MRRARLLLRAVVILLLVTRQVLRYALGSLGMRLRGRGRAERQAFFGACVLTLFRQLGATFIKVGQIMSTRPDLLPPYVIDALSQLQDNVGPFDFSAVRAIVAEDLGRPLEQVFPEFSPAP